MTWTLTVLVNNPKGGTAFAARYSGSVAPDAFGVAVDTVRIESRPKTACGWSHVSWTEDVTSRMYGPRRQRIRQWPAIRDYVIQEGGDDHVDIVLKANFQFTGNNLIMTDHGRTKILTGRHDNAKILVHK